MTSILIKIIKYIFINNPIYKLYLSIPSKIEFGGIQNFSPIFTNKKKLTNLLKIEDNYFSKNKKNLIPIKMHSFEWLTEFREVGGVTLLKKSRNMIIDWCNCNYKFSSDIWSDIIVARRMVNLAINYDFFGHTAELSFKNKIIDLINKHYKYLITQYYFHSDKYEIDLEISKALLIISSLLNKNNNFEKIINLIKNQIRSQVNIDGFHKSINVVEQARFIQQLLEIKNILLFNKKNTWHELDIQINDMISLLKNMFHKDFSLPLFNGANNKNSIFVKNLANLKKDLKIKKLFKISNGIIVVNANKTKIFFDTTLPNSKLLNKKLHSGTLSFELSYNNEKIITNCGSPEKYFGKNQVFFRYSAAHSTVTINNTNVSELSEKNSYKRIPKNIRNNSEELTSHFLISGSHDGYSNNYNVLIKRILKIAKNGNTILGSDQIFNLKRNNKKNKYQIRFHLMPHCDCAITNNNKKIIIKSKTGLAWYFESKNHKLSIGDSIYIGEGDYTTKTKQIVLSGIADKMKYSINWKLQRAN